MITLRCVNHGHWETDDGSVLVSLDDSFTTECEDAHPVRLSMKYWDSFADHYKRRLMDYGARRKGAYMVWQCPGGEHHHYSQWTVQVDGEWTDDVYDTFAQARDALEKIVGKVKLARRRAVKDVPVEPAKETDDDAHFRAVLEDEREGLRNSLARFGELLSGPDAQFVDVEAVQRNQRRLAEVERLLLTVAA